MGIHFEFEVAWTSWLFGIEYFNSDPTRIYSQDAEMAVIVRIGPMSLCWSWLRNA